ncbi:MAG: hypothetical protein ACYC5X_11485 [Syntrophales bacterium]
MTDKQPIINITNSLVLPEQKKAWHETLIGKITVGVTIGVIVFLIGLFIGKLHYKTPAATTPAITATTTTNKINKPSTPNIIKPHPPLKK